jgi:hypothetical protein
MYLNHKIIEAWTIEVIFTRLTSHAYKKQRIENLVILSLSADERTKKGTVWLSNELYEIRECQA